MTVSLQVMTALRFYATGSFQAVTADVHRISWPSVSRVINDVTNCLVRISHEHIKMPTQQELVNVMGGFHELSGFPNVIGAINGTRIRIKSPPNDEHFIIPSANEVQGPWGYIGITLSVRLSVQIRVHVSP